MKASRRVLLAACLGLLAFFVLNAAAIAWIRATDFADPAFADGSAALLTLAIPALLSGLLTGGLAREQGLNTSVFTFALFAIVSLVSALLHPHPFWQIPLVSPRSAHSRLLHYFIYNPLVALAFGTLGGWLGQQFGTGRFTIADREPVIMQGLEE